LEPFVKTSVERVDDTTVKLSVTVEASRVDAAIDEAARELGRSVKIPGFRPGRVPRRVLESRLGRGALLQEAVRDALPQFYSEAVQAEDLQVVSSPELDVETFDGGKDASFTATVEVRPEIAVPDLSGVQVAHPDWEVTDEELAQQLDAMRERFAEIETVQRPAQVGDHAVVTINATRNGQLVEEASEADVLREIGDPQQSDSAVDRALVGASAGAILKASDTLGDDFGPDLAGQEVEFTIIVKEVKAKKLPDLDDDFALTASEFDSLEELRTSLREEMGRQKRAYAEQELRGTVVEAVSDLVDVPLPKGMVSDEQQFRLRRLAQQAEAYGMDLEQFAGAVSGSLDELTSQMEEEARKTVKAQLVLDAIAREHGVEVSQEDLGAEVARQAARTGQPPEELARFMTHPDRLPALIADAYRRKTIDHLVETLQVLGGPPPETGDDERPAAGGDDEGRKDPQEGGPEEG
jgi:trigger factor